MPKNSDFEATIAEQTATIENWETWAEEMNAFADGLQEQILIHQNEINDLLSKVAESETLIHGHEADEAETETWIENLQGTIRTLNAKVKHLITENFTIATSNQNYGQLMERLERLELDSKQLQSDSTKAQANAVKSAALIQALEAKLGAQREAGLKREEILLATKKELNATLEEQKQKIQMNKLSDGNGGQQDEIERLTKDIRVLKDQNTEIAKHNEHLLIVHRHNVERYNEQVQEQRNDKVTLEALVREAEEKMQAMQKTLQDKIASVELLRGFNPFSDVLPGETYDQKLLRANAFLIEKGLAFSKERADLCEEKMKAVRRWTRLSRKKEKLKEHYLELKKKYEPQSADDTAIFSESDHSGDEGADEKDKIAKVEN